MQLVVAFHFLRSPRCLSKLLLQLSFVVGTAILFAIFIGNALKLDFVKSNTSGKRPPERQILNSHRFSYLIPEADFCAAGRFPNLFLLIIVHSSVHHHKLRMYVRKTWGSRNLYKELGIATVFLLGKSNPKDGIRAKNIAAAIQLESEQYHDIVQEDYIDSYRNLTYKAISGLRWITTYCQKPAFVLKADDDIFVNTYRLVYYLRNIDMTNKGIESLLCLKWNRMPIVRNNLSKWFVSNREYGTERYPPYCSGSAVIIPTRVAPRLYNASFYRPFFWVDDVYVTGMLAEEANVTLTSIPTWYVFSEKLFDRKLVYGYGVFGHHLPFLTNQDRLKYWNKIKLREVYRTNTNDTFRLVNSKM